MVSLGQTKKCTTLNKEKLNMYKLTGKVKWAHVQSPNTKFEPVYSIDLIMENNAMADMLSRKGFNVKEYKDEHGTPTGERYLQVKRKTKKKSGDDAGAPKVTDEFGAEFNQLIGNGSMCTVGFGGIEWNSSFGSGTAAYLNEVVVLEHVPYGDNVNLNEELDKINSASGS